MQIVGCRAFSVKAGTRVLIEGKSVYRKYDRTIETEAGPAKMLEALPCWIARRSRNGKAPRKSAVLWTNVSLSINAERATPGTAGSAGAELLSRKAGQVSDASHQHVM